ncbi:MAG: Uma2 family endonuclease [Labilithrix sp.]|nr:Uma2 family endonuclease [Labilithrix sp.]
MVEVAHTSQRKDRVLKAPLYAECNVPEYWLVDVPSRVVEVYTAPAGSSYASVVRRGAGDRIALVDFPDVSIAVDELF